MSNNLNSLLARVEKTDAALARELQAQIYVLEKRREFGLNFEKHKPETMELYGRRLRVGDRVRFLASRGNVEFARRETWIVESLDSSQIEVVASLKLEEGKETATRLIEDLVVVADFREPIYPGLKSTGKIDRGGDKPFHTVINAENYHALEAMLFTYQGKVDAIYIDPPYNTRDKDWKYNNDYVDGDDGYKHSKWLSFMERRLKLAKKLLNPKDSVLIVTIDDNEVHRLGLLLEQVFQGRSVQMVTTVINPRGHFRDGTFSRTEEYIFFVTQGSARVQGEPDEDYSEGAAVPWRTLRRSDLDSARGTKKGGTNQFYPIYINDKTGRIDSVGAPLQHGVDRSTSPRRRGCTAVFPSRDDDTEMNWGLTPGSLQTLIDHGYVRVGRHTPSKLQAYELSYLTSGRISDIVEGRAKVQGFDDSGAVIAQYITHKIKMPVSNWVRDSHNAETNGTAILKALLGQKLFPYPKALYAVEDALRYFVGLKPESLIIDFFAGSGTTAHAVMRLNHQDGGRRRSVVVTNNEVSSVEAQHLSAEGYRPGDPGWEAVGICNVVTKPRIRAAVTGKRPDGIPVAGDYKYVDEFPMADGFEENVEFFDLTYEDPRLVGLDLEFLAVSPLLWMRAGSEGRRINAQNDTFDVADTYGVLFSVDAAAPFLKAIGKVDGLRIVYIVTDDEKQFQMIASGLPLHVEAVRLYESYLRTFEINTGKE